MKPVAFDHLRPPSLDAALSALDAPEARAGARIIAGGQSLGPMLNLRLARPERLLDVSGLPELQEIRETESHVEIGAAVTHARIEDGACPEPAGGMLRHVASGIAYRAVRNRGTIGGSLCHADPAADWVTALVALEASVILRGPGGARREMPVERFVRGAYLTALAPGEILTSIRIPRRSAAVAWGYYKICRKVGEFADAIGAFLADPPARICRVVIGATGGAPLVSETLAHALATTGAPAAPDVVRDVLRQALPALSDIKRQQLAIAHIRSVTGGS
ncbi:MAG: FAD binding domain-containing protein [Roseovarius sp.]